MTTLGDIFGKLSGVRLLSILKWYGRVVMWVAFAGVVLVLMTAFVWLVILVVASLPWWATVGLLVLASAWAALKIADPDALRSDFDRKLDKMNRDILMGNGEQKTVLRKSVSNWQEIRDVVEMMREEDCCNIHFDGEEFHFENRQAALDFLDGKTSQ